MDPAQSQLLISSEMLSRMRQTLIGVPFQSDPSSISPSWAQAGEDQYLLAITPENAPRRVGAAVGGFVIAMIVTALIAKRRR